MHGNVEELLPSYALGALDSDEEALVQHHVRDCNACAAALGRHLEIAAALSLSTDEVTPPAGLKERIMDAATGARVLSLPAPSQHSRKRFQATRWNPLVAVAAAAAVVVIMLGGWNLALQQRLTTTQSQLATNQVLRGDIRSTAGASVGAVSYLSRDNLALVSFHGLDRPASKVYELWVIDASGRADPVQTFLPDGDGTKLIVVSRRIAASDQLAVTEEPPGGSRIPSSAPIFSGKI